MRNLTTRFAPAAVSARGDFRAFLSEIYNKDYSDVDAKGVYIVLCNGEVVNNPALNAMDKKTLEHVGVYHISNTAPEYVFKIFEAEARARARANQY